MGGGGGGGGRGGGGGGGGGGGRDGRRLKEEEATEVIEDVDAAAADSYKTCNGNGRWEVGVALHQERVPAPAGEKLSELATGNQSKNRGKAY